MEWIKCEDKMPDNNTDCLVVDDGDVCFAHFIIGYNNIPYFNSTDDNGEYKNVTHWMPLPEAP